jgi:hypothetical protein
LCAKTFAWKGFTCIDNFKARGNKKTEEKNQQLESDIRSLAEPESQIDPKFQTAFKYTRITAKAMRQALITKKCWKDENLPCEKTIRGSSFLKKNLNLEW